MTALELKQTFQTYFDEMDKCLRAGCYWALVHLIVIMPDICGALESEDGQATFEQYKQWAECHLAGSILQPNEWYGLRCVLLHQGRTLGGGGRYQNYVFSAPLGKVVHENVPKGAVHLDVREMTKELQAAMDHWFTDIEANKNAGIVKNITRNLPALAREHVEMRQPVGLPGSYQVPIVMTNTTSSP